MGDKYQGGKIIFLITFFLQYRREKEGVREGFVAARLKRGLSKKGSPLPHLFLPSLYILLRECF
jgi:hypothetical protein